MGRETKLYVKVCSECGRQVTPHIDHNLGPSRIVYCDHGTLGLGMRKATTWKRIEVVPAINETGDMSTSDGLGA